jgi:hypothetical protein
VGTLQSNRHQTPVSRFQQLSSVLAFQPMTSASGRGCVKSRVSGTILLSSIGVVLDEWIY